MGCWLPLKEDNWLDEEDGGECMSHDGGCSHWLKSMPETTTSKLRKPLNLKEDTTWNNWPLLAALSIGRSGIKIFIRSTWQSKWTIRL